MFLSKLSFFTPLQVKSAKLVVAVGRMVVRQFCRETPVHYIYIHLKFYFVVYNIEFRGKKIRIV